MESIELGLDEAAEPITQAPAPAVARRLPTGTLPPPVGVAADELADELVATDEAHGEIEALLAQADHLQSTRAWAELAQTLRRTIDLVELAEALDEEALIALYARLARVEADELGHLDLAVEAWRKAIALDATDLRAFVALETLLAQAGRWGEVIETIERRALVLDDEPERGQALLAAAAIYEDQLADPGRAAEVYERVRRAELAGEPRHAALARLEAIYARAHRWAELVEIMLERSEAVAEVADQIQILHEIARIYERELDDQESAFYVLQAAFARDHTHAKTLRELERLATAGARWEELLEETGKRASELEADDAPGAADLWVKIGRWYADRFAHPEYAIHSLQQALRLQPQHARARAALAELQPRQGGGGGDLTETLRRQAAAEPLHEKRVELYVQIAEAIEERAGDPAHAIAAYEEVLTHDPSSRVALAALARLHRRAEAWAPLVAVMTRWFDRAADDAERAERCVDLGEIFELRLGDATQAIAAYERALAHAPGHRVALRALEQLYEQTGQSERHLANLEAQLDGAASDAERMAIYARLAALWEERFGKLDRAADAYEQIRAIDPRNDATYRELERLYQQAGRYDQVVETYRGHIAATPDRARRAELSVAMGKICETRLQANADAIRAYEDALACAGDDAHTLASLTSLGRLYELAGEWDRALAALARLVELDGELRRQDLYFRMGRIQHRELDDTDGGEASWRRALAIDPAHLPTMEALAELYAERGDWREAAAMLERAAAATQVLVDKVRLLFEAATVATRHLGDVAEAARLCAAVIALDPEHVEAARPLATVYFDAQRWDDLAPVIDMLCRKAEHPSIAPRERVELTCRAARCAEAQGLVPKARDYYAEAHRLDPTHLPTLTGRAELLFKTRDWEPAARAYEAIVARGAGAAPDVVRHGYHRLGQIHVALGDRDHALQMYGKALELDPHHRDTLLAVIDLRTQRGDWGEVVHAKRGLMATASEREKVKLTHEIAAIYRERLASAPKALAAYTAALAEAPEDRQLLQQVLDLHIEAKHWRDAVAIIERFIALEQDAFHQGVYYHAAATLCRDELKAIDEAVELYDHALDAFFAQPDRLDDKRLARALHSFQAIDTMLTTARDWRAQERAYRDMIKRLPPGGDPRFLELQVRLVDGLGEIYRSRLKQYDKASSAFEIAQELDPDNALRPHGADRAEILAELHMLAGPDRADKAIAQHARMLRREPFKYDSYSALARIYRDTQQYDKLWCLCSTLAFLKKASPDELRFYEQYKPAGLAKAKTAMSAATWAALAHDDENRSISAIFAACGESVAVMKGLAPKDVGVRREERRQLEGDQLLFSRLFVYAAQVLGTRLPDVYLRDDDKAVDLQLANLIDKGELAPSFLVRAALLHGRSEREVAFQVARRLAFMRPEYYLRMLLPSNAELTVALLAAIVLVQPHFPVPSNLAASIQQYLPAMKKRLPRQTLDLLGEAVHRFVQTAPDLRLARWCHAVDAASHRAGFVVCGDLEVAARAVAVEPVVLDGPTAKERIRELVLFSISESYFRARAQMGLAIG